jgi:hypothetical protein
MPHAHLIHVSDRKQKRRRELPRRHLNWRKKDMHILLLLLLIVVILDLKVKVIVTRR